MSEKSEPNKSAFVFKDSRRFDSEGNIKDEQPSEPKVVVETAKRSEPEPKFEKQEFTHAPVEDDPQSEVNFSGFIMSFATQAMMQLGEMEPPAGMNLPKDTEAARQTIEIISMLERKTKGNLSQNEAKLVEDILHNLRIAYVRSVKK